MDKRFIKKTLFKLLLANIIVTFIVWLLMFFFGEDVIASYGYRPTIFIQNIGVLITLILITGFMFWFENRKETWIMCNVLAVLAGILMGISEYFFYGEELNTLLFIVFFPFTGIYTLCDLDVGGWMLSDWLMIVLGVGIFICCQNLFLVPTLIKDHIQKRKISFRKPPEKVIEPTSDENES